MESKNVLLTMILIPLIADAQKSSTVGLQVGDHVPDVIMNNIRNYDQRSAKLSDFKGKLVILDFWDKNCAACIAGFPKMEKLQNEFTGKLQILAVTMNNSDDLKRLFEKSTILKTTKLPLVLADSILHALFPHTFVPYHVWISAKGRVLAVTESYNVTSDRIKQVLESKNVSMRNLQPSTYDKSDYIISEGNGRQVSNVQYYSLITDRLLGNDRIVNGILIDSLTKKKIGLYAWNNSRLTLLGWAFAVPKDRIVCEVSNPQDYIKPRDPKQIDDWKTKNTISYELKMPGYELNEMRSKMQQDLQIYFKIKAVKEMRSVKCLVLVRTTGIDLLKTKFPSKESKFEQLHSKFVIHNGMLTSFVTHLGITLKEKSGNLSMPLLDETNYKGRVDLEVNCDLSDISTVNSELSKYGLKLIEAERQLNVLIVRDLSM